MTTLVRDLMHPGLITCPPQATLGQAASLLLRHRVHALVVVGAEGQPLGILSDTDMLSGEWLVTDAESLAVMRKMTAGQLMTPPAATVEASTPASEAAARMRAGQIHRLVVVEGGRVVGVISVSDLVASLAHAPVGPRTVAEAMSRGLVVCRGDTPVSAAARAMIERRSRSLVVVDPQGRPRGVVTGFDLLALFASGDATDKQTVSGIMHPPLTIHRQATLRETADLMLHHHVHRLLVVDPANPDEMPLGVISTSDIIAEMAEPGSVWQ